jgi:DNA-binding GntR family transcriptional regulator
MVSPGDADGASNPEGASAADGATIDAAADGAAAPATDRAYAWTKARILDGSYAGGELISEGQVGLALGLSRTPVREAFLRLSAEGLLRLFPKRGALVVPVTAEELRDVLQARGLLEGWACAQLAAAGTSAALIVELRACLERQRAATADGDARVVQEADRAFHHAIVRGAGNTLFTAFHAGLRDRQLRMGAWAIAGRPRRPASILAEHEQLIALLEAGDVTGARRLSDEHLEGTRRALSALT